MARKCDTMIAKEYELADHLFAFLVWFDILCANGKLYLLSKHAAAWRLWIATSLFSWTVVAAGRTGCRTDIACFPSSHWTDAPQRRCCSHSGLLLRCDQSLNALELMSTSSSSTRPAWMQSASVPSSPQIPLSSLHLPSSLLNSSGGPAPLTPSSPTLRPSAPSSRTSRGSALERELLHCRDIPDDDDYPNGLWQLREIIDGKIHTIPKLATDRSRCSNIVVSKTPMQDQRRRDRKWPT